MSPEAQMLSPILLQGTVTVSPGQKAEVPFAAVQNPFKTAMLVDEIRFSANATGSNTTNLVLQAEMFVGRVPLTNGPIPLRSFGRTLNWYDACFQNSIPSTWKLPQPMYIHAVERLIIKIYYLPGFLVPDRTVTTIVVGRSLPANQPPPKVVHFPWVAHFMTPFAENVDQVDTSTEANLMNPFREVLHVQRFIGRYDNLANSASTREVSGLTEKETNVRASDSFGNILVRDPTPFAHLFQAPTRTWTINSQLAPNGFYLFTVDRTWDAGAFSGTVAISMVGHHDVELR